MQDRHPARLHSLDVLAQRKDRVTEHFRRIFRRESLPESVREKDPTRRSDETGCGRRVSSAPRQACAAPTQRRSQLADATRELSRGKPDSRVETTISSRLRARA